MKENDLILILKNDLEEINTSLSLLSSKISLLNGCINICNNIIITNSSDIIKIDLEKLFNDIDFNDIDTIQKLKIYQKLSSNDSYPIDDEQRKEIIELFQKINEYILYKKNALLEEESDLKSKKSILQNIINKLNENNIDIGVYKSLCNYLSNDDNDLDNKLDLLIELSLKLNLKPNYVEIEDQPMEEVSTTNLEVEKLNELFNKYGYNFFNISDDVSNGFFLKVDDKQVSPRQYILKLGNYNNIEEILSIFRKNDVNIDFNKYSKQLSILFVLSNGYNIETIINNIKNDLKTQHELDDSFNFTFDEIFIKFIKHPSLFIKGKKYWGKLKENNSENSSNLKNATNVVCGAYNNYLENRKLFIELGINIIASLDECFSVFDLSSKTVRKNVEILNQYGIGKEQYANSLSCLSTDSYKIASTIDKFIELGSFNLGLGGYEHIKNNLTNLCRDTTPLLNRLINAASMGYGVSELFHITYKGMKYMSLCTNFLKGFPSDAIYINGKEIIPELFELSTPSLASINFDTVSVPQRSDLLSNYYVMKLEKFREKDLYYKFNEIYISRNKVLRNINILLQNNMLNDNTLLYAITRNSILTKEQCEKVQNCVNHILSNFESTSKGGI